MIVRRLSRRAVLTTVGVVLSAAAALGVSSPAAAAACDPAETSNRWTGGADGLWDTAGNWSLGRAPDNSDGETGLVCIDSATTVTMADGVSANLQAIDLGPGATLNIKSGAKLYVLGDHATQPSRIRSGATVRLNGVLGGSGQINLAGRLLWRATAGGASTITTRDCALFDPGCNAPVTGESGLLRVLDNGRVDIDGRGVNLHDQYDIRVYGTVRVAGEGYVAAQDGTGIALRPKLSGLGVGRFTIANDGGWYEGTFTEGTNQQPPSTFVNAGLLAKTGGTGSSSIDASYGREGSGSARVDAGTLRLPENADQAVDVAPSRAVGTGDCAVGGSLGCGAATNADDQQNSTVRLPGAGTDANGATLTVRELAADPDTTSLGVPVRAHAAGLRATRRAPVRMELRYDSSVLGGRGWQDIRVLRRPDGAPDYRRVPTCLSDGRAPRGSAACVDRRRIPNTSSRTLSDGDVVMVVRTTAFSRWCGR